MMKEKSSGVLMHISSLPSEYGIGTMGVEARKFVDFLEAAGQSYWADAAHLPHQLRRFPLSVFLYLRRKSVFY